MKVLITKTLTVMHCYSVRYVSVNVLKGVRVFLVQIKFTTHVLALFCVKVRHLCTTYASPVYHLELFVRGPVSYFVVTKYG